MPLPEELTDDEVESFRRLRSRGFALVIFTPEELQGASLTHVEDRLVELGWEVIDSLKEHA